VLDVRDADAIGFDHELKSDRKRSQNQHASIGLPNDVLGDRELTHGLATSGVEKDADASLLQSATNDVRLKVEGGRRNPAGFYAAVSDAVPLSGYEVRVLHCCVVVGLSLLAQNAFANSDS
jgi:hypothetical protein